MARDRSPGTTGDSVSVRGGGGDDETAYALRALRRPRAYAGSKAR